MSIEFEADYRGGSMPSFKDRPATGMAGWLVRAGIAKNAMVAKFILLVVVLFNIAVSVVIVTMFL
jgi:hypothetical protein